MDDLRACAVVVSDSPLDKPGPKQVSLARLTTIGQLDWATLEQSGQDDKEPWWDEGLPFFLQWLGRFQDKLILQGAAGGPPIVRAPVDLVMVDINAQPVLSGIWFGIARAIGAPVLTAKRADWRGDMWIVSSIEERASRIRRAHDVADKPRYPSESAAIVLAAWLLEIMRGTRYPSPTGQRIGRILDGAQNGARQPDAMARS